MITFERLHELLIYDPDTGVFTWLRAPSSRAKIGNVAGSPNHGYWRIVLGGRPYSAHRLAWLYMTGEWPKDQIDHVDLNRANNKWSNLREATHSQNQANRRALSHSTSGLKGVSLRKDTGKWQAQIAIGGRYHHLGCFRTKEDAHAAYVGAAEKYHGEYARTE